MNTHTKKPDDDKSQSVANAQAKNRHGQGGTSQFADNRPEYKAQLKLQEAANSNNPRVKQLSAFQENANQSSPIKQWRAVQPLASHDAFPTVVQQARKKNQSKKVNNITGSASSAFSHLGFLIDLAVPNPGDKSKLEVEMKIPCDPSGGGFVGFHVVCASERKKQATLNARCEVTVTGGVKFGGLYELKAEFGGYFESEGANSSQVMKLISYAIYRRFVESKVLPQEISNYMWGGSTSTSGHRRAVQWGRNVEEELKSAPKKTAAKPYVETGGILAGTAQGGIKDVGSFGLSGKVAVKGAYGTRYDATSIEDRDNRVGIAGVFLHSKKHDPNWYISPVAGSNAPKITAGSRLVSINGIKVKVFALQRADNDKVKSRKEVLNLLSGKVGTTVDIMVADKEGNNTSEITIKRIDGEILPGRGAPRSAGRSVYLMEPSVEGQLGPFKASGKLKCVWLDNPKKDDAITGEEFTLEMNGMGTLPMHQMVAGHAYLFGAVVVGGAQIWRSINDKRDEDKKSKGKAQRIAGILLGISEDIAISAVQLANIPATEFTAFKEGKSLNDFNGWDASKGEVGARITLRVKFKRQDRNNPSANDKKYKKSIEIQLEYAKLGQMQLVNTIMAAQQNAVDFLTLKAESFSRLLTLKFEENEWKVSKGENWEWNPELTDEATRKKKKAAKAALSKGNTSSFTDKSDNKRSAARTL